MQSHFATPGVPSSEIRVVVGHRQTGLDAKKQNLRAPAQDRSGWAFFLWVDGYFNGIIPTGGEHREESIVTLLPGVGADRRECL